MGSPFQDLMSAQRSTPGTHIGDQGLSPPYSNQSPPHSVQSNIALSPQGYIGKSQYNDCIGIVSDRLFTIRLLSFRLSITSKIATHITNPYAGDATCDPSKAWATESYGACKFDTTNEFSAAESTAAAETNGKCLRLAIEKHALRWFVFHNFTNHNFSNSHNSNRLNISTIRTGKCNRYVRW